MSLPHPRTRRAWFAALVILLASPALAQTGTVTGVVVDAATGESLIGVNVQVFPVGAEAMITGAATDLDGHYRITALDPGTYDLLFSYVGYHERHITRVEVAAGQTAVLDVPLTEEAVEVGEAVVEARLLRDSGAALLRDRQRAAAVSDAVAADDMARAGASSAADALGRVTGTSVVGGRYVVVRGLADRYVNVQLNGATLPSADPDRNAVPLDLFPSGLLDNVVTAKTFTPDQPGSFTGGNVSVNTRAFPEALTYGFSTSVGYDAGASLRGALAAETGGRDWLGFDDGTRSIPDPWAAPGTRVPSISAARTDPDSAAALDRLAHAFSPFMAPGTAEAPLNRSFAGSLGNRVSLFGRPLGFLASLTYSRDVAAYAGGTTAQWQLTGAVAETDSLTNNLRLDDTRTTAEVLWGGLATIAYRPHPNHSVGASYVYNRGATSEARYQVGLYPKNFNATDRFFETRTLRWTERALGTVQLRGEHAFPALGGLRAEWATSLARTRQEEPDLRFFANDFTVRQNDGAPADTFYAITFSNYGKPARYFRDLDEDRQDHALDLALPLGGRAAGLLKAGVAVSLTDRDLAERRFEYTTNASAYRYDGDPEAFFTDGMGVVDTTASGRFTIGNYVLDATTPTNNYEGAQDVYAAYAMAELRPLARLRVIAGARLEATRQRVANADTTGRIREDDLLPSLNLVYEVTEAMNVRAAYGRTLARPSLREFSPAITFEYVGGYLFIGNPGLERTLVDNLDLRWEWFTRPGEIVAASAFYKRFQSPIERAFIGINDQIQFQNVDEAAVIGAEFEARRRFERLPVLPGVLEVGANLTLAHSRVRIPDFELAILRALDPDAPDTRPLQGQSPFVGNLDVAYRHDGTGTVVSALYNVFGERLASVSLGGTPNDYEFATGTLDLTLRQRLWRGLGLSAAAKNVLGGDARFGHTYKSVEYVTRAYARPRTFSVGLSYRFD